MSESLGHKAAAGAMWASIDRFGTMALQFIVNLVLANLLLPLDFGAIGMLMIFISVSQVLIDGGFGSALIQKKEPTQTDYSTILFWNVGLSIILYLILYFWAPAIGNFYSMPILSNVLRVIGVSLIINAVLGIQKNRLQKQFAFKLIAITQLGSYIFGSVCAIIMAYYNFGVWSLVALQIISGISSLCILWLITRWHPSRCFSIQTIRELFGFGGYIFAANLLQEICKNFQGVIIGKKFSATQMGYYSQANKLDQITSYSIPQVIVQVMYPVYASIQDDHKRLVEMLAMNIRVIAFLIFPILALLILVSEPLIFLLYGEKWLPSVPYFKVLCVGGFFVCLQNVNFYAVAAIGKSKNLFYWSFYKWGFLVGAILIGMKFGMFGILWGMVLSNINIYIINSSLVYQNIGMGIIYQFQCLVPVIIATLISALIYEATMLYLNSYLISISIFAISYITIGATFKFKCYKETQELFNRLFYRK